MDPEGVKRVVKAQVVLQLDREVAQHTPNEPDEKRACEKYCTVKLQKKTLLLNLTGNDTDFFGDSVCLKTIGFTRLRLSDGVIEAQAVLQLDREIPQHTPDKPDEKRACGVKTTNLLQKQSHFLLLLLLVIFNSAVFTFALRRSNSAVCTALLNLTSNNRVFL